MVYQLFVHSTTKNSSTLYDVASEFPAQRPNRSAPGRGSAVDSSEAIRNYVADVVAEKINTKAARKAVE
ncbi:MAG: hypothetical protein JWN99_647, partial [Ilumatobacteraceae bacterium]|nr:hypothetical protein [Ilumatobacteraceae bacterium]